MNETITLFRSSYDNMLGKIRDLAKENHDLRKVASKNEDVERVIIKVVDIYGSTVSYDFKNFEDVKESVEEQMKKDVSELQDEVVELSSKIDKLRKENCEVAEHLVEAQMEVSRLKRRNLWKRIFNR